MSNPPKDDYSPNRGMVRFKFYDSDEEDYLLRFNWRAIYDIEEDLDMSFAEITDEDGNLRVRLGDFGTILWHGMKQWNDELTREDVFDKMDMHNFNDNVLPAFLEAFNASQPPEEVMEEREEGAVEGNPTDRSPAESENEAES